MFIEGSVEKLLRLPWDSGAH